MQVYVCTDLASITISLECMHACIMKPIASRMPYRLTSKTFFTVLAEPISEVYILVLALMFQSDAATQVKMAQWYNLQA